MPDNTVGSKDTKRTGLKHQQKAERFLVKRVQFVGLYQEQGCCELHAHV